MLEHSTDGRFVSTPHHVANGSGGPLSAVFANPDYYAVVAPLARGASAERLGPLACGPYVEAAYRAAWPRAMG